MKKACLTSIPVLLLSAGLLWAMLPLLYPGWAEGEQTAEPQVLLGTDFSPVVAAEARSEGNSLLITRMQTDAAVFRANPRFDASRYPQLRLHLQGLHPESRLFLFWRTAELPTRQRSLELDHYSSGAQWFTPGHSEFWRGTVLEVAIGVFGEAGTEPLRLRELAFHGVTRERMVARMISEWSSFQPWLHSAMNLHRGIPPAGVVHPNAVAALGVAIALFLLVIAAAVLRLSRRTVIVAGLLVLFLPWLVLDLLWQGQLNTRVALSHKQFGGLDQQTKHQRDLDSALFNYAQELRTLVPADPRQRLFLLHDSRGHNYQRLRLQFHLLPLNIYNYGSTLLPVGEMRPGDYVLQFGALEELHYDPASSLLTGNNQRWQALLLSQHELGRLFRLTAELPPLATGQR